MEHNSRRSFPKAWSGISGKQTNKFYHQSEINSELSNQLKLKDLCPFVHNNQGESQFVSPEMYKPLQAVCRCGRTRESLHMGKCLQRALSPDYKQAMVLNGTDAWNGEPLNVPSTSSLYVKFLMFSAAVSCVRSVSLDQRTKAHTSISFRIQLKMCINWHPIFILAGLSQLGAAQEPLIFETSRNPWNNVASTTTIPISPTSTTNLVLVNNVRIPGGLTPFVPAPPPTQEFLNCFGNCPTTSQYNPICGSNMQLYMNEEKFNCARFCGAAIIFGPLQFQSTVLADPVFRRPNALAIAPARTYTGGYNHSTIHRAVEKTTWTAPAVHQPVLQAPGFIIPSQNRSWIHTNQGSHGDLPGSVPAQASGFSSGRVASNNPQTGVTGVYQPNPSQGKIVNPAFVVGKNNGTFYSTYNTTVPVRTYPYGNL
ncbi:GM14292 [Drosophila sechellia]|uniref:GM14292 n=1 Tax=Drosophila sechellia TaxID=7238 RepID=B4HVD2_DROSE|nr:GM14292 [Drosophila sechellia]